MTRAFDTIMAGLLDALAYAQGDKYGCTTHAPAELEQATPPKGGDVGSNPTGRTKIKS